MHSNVTDRILLDAINASGNTTFISLPLDLTLEQAGFDSLALAEIVMQIEERIGRTLDEIVLARLADCTNIGELLAAFDDGHG